MFKTLSIYDCSQEFKRKVNQHNSKVFINEYLSTYGLCDEPIGSYQEEYVLCYVITVQYCDGDINDIKFAFRTNDKERYADHNYVPDIIIGGNILDTRPENAIRQFCAKYGESLFDGYSIESLARNDEENILNYEYNNVRKK